MRLVRKTNGFPYIVNRLFSEDFDRMHNDAGYRDNGGTLPAVNVKEDEKAFQVELAVPGFKKDDFNIKVEAGILSISTEVKHEDITEDDRFSHREFVRHSFTRKFSLPEDEVEDENIQAKYEHGVLALNIPKKEKAEKVSRMIDVS
jgi:HSP20 family protein